MRSLSVLIAIAAVAALSSCGGGDSKRSPEGVLDAALARGSYGVGMTTVDLVDTTRPTAANHEYPGSDSRTISTDIYYPAANDATEPEQDAAVDTSGAPYPTIVLSHGLSALSALYGTYGQHLASHGYVVVLPNYPLSNLAAPGGPRLNAVLEQPKDVSFVIDEMLAFNDEAGNRFEGAIDAERIGATGHSLGAMTTFMSVYGPDRDDRIKAALPFALPGCFFPESYVANVSVPILFTSGTNDLITPPVSSDHGYEIARVPRYLVTITGADHTRFAEADVADSAVVGNGGLENIGQGDFLADATQLGRLFQGDVTACGLGAEPAGDPLLDADRQREILRVLEVSFFDAYLKQDDDSIAALEELDNLIPEISVQSDTDAG